MRSIRWPSAILITVAVAIGYLDRQTLALTTKAIQQDIPISDNDFGNLQSMFYFAYALMYLGGGRLINVLGSQRGFLLTIRKVQPIALYAEVPETALVSTRESS